MPVDEPGDAPAATDAGPSPQELLAASLASCTAVTMEMYADRKGWKIGDVEVACDYTPPSAAARRASPPACLPDDLPDEQVERLNVIAAKCPVHRTLDGEVMFDERVERVALAR